MLSVKCAKRAEAAGAWRKELAVVDSIVDKNAPVHHFGRPGKKCLESDVVEPFQSPIGHQEATPPAVRYLFLVDFFLKEWVVSSELLRRERSV